VVGVVAVMLLAATAVLLGLTALAMGVAHAPPAGEWPVRDGTGHRPRPRVAVDLYVKRQVLGQAFKAGFTVETGRWQRHDSDSDSANDSDDDSDNDSDSDSAMQCWTARRLPCCVVFFQHQRMGIGLRDALVQC
jgi:hypothetical protein